MSNVRHDRPVLNYYGYSQYHEPAFSGYNKDKPEQDDNLNPTLTPKPWLQTASGMRGSQPNVDLSPEESQLQVPRAARQKTRMLTRQAGLVHNDSNADQIYNESLQDIYDKFNQQDCKDWESGDSTAGKFQDEIRKSRNTEKSQDLALQDWMQMQQEACSGATNPSDSVEGKFQLGMVALSNMMENVYGASWVDPKQGGVPTAIQDWIVADKTQNQSAQWQLVSDWVNLYTQWALNIKNGDPSGGLLNTQSFSEFFGGNNPSAMVETGTYTSSAPPALAGKQVIVEFNNEVIADHLAYAWSWLTTNQPDVANQIANSLTNLGQNGTSPVGDAFLNGPPKGVSAGVVSLNPVQFDSDGHAIAAASSTFSEYKYDDLQNFAGWMLYYMWIIWFHYVINSGAGSGTSNDPNVKPTTLPCTTAQATAAGCSNPANCVVDSTGTPVCGGDPVNPVDPSSNCNSIQHSYWDSTSNQCVCDTHYTLTDGQCVYDIHHGKHTGGGGGSNTGGGGTGKDKCPKGQTWDTKTNKCVKNDDSKTLEEAGIGLVVALVAIVGGLFVYKSYGYQADVGY